MELHKWIPQPPAESETQELTSSSYADHGWQLENPLKDDYRRIFESTYRKLKDGLAQDPNFPRAKEYFSKMHKIRQAATAVGCQKSQASTEQFFQDCLQEAEKDFSRAEQEIFQGRIERAEDLCYACEKSDPHDEKELNKKKLFLTEVLEAHLIPMRQEKILPVLRNQLESVITSYQRVLKYLTDFNRELFIEDMS